MEEADTEPGDSRTEQQPKRRGRPKKNPDGLNFQPGSASTPRVSRKRKASDGDDGKTPKKARRTSSGSVVEDRVVPPDVLAKWKTQLDSVQLAQCPECRGVLKTIVSATRHFTKTHSHLLVDAPVRDPDIECQADTQTPREDAADVVGPSVASLDTPEASSYAREWDQGPLVMPSSSAGPSPEKVEEGSIRDLEDSLTESSVVSNKLIEGPSPGSGTVKKKLGRQKKSASVVDGNSSKNEIFDDSVVQSDMSNLTAGPHSSTVQKKKRGRPKKSVNVAIENVTKDGISSDREGVDKGEESAQGIESAVADEGVKESDVSVLEVSTGEKKAKRGRPKKAEVSVKVDETAVGDEGVKESGVPVLDVSTGEKKAKRGRPKKAEVPLKFDETAGGDEGVKDSEVSVIDVSTGEKKAKRGRPKKAEVEVDEIACGDDSLADFGASASTKKKAGRPKKNRRNSDSEIAKKGMGESPHLKRSAGRPKKCKKVSDKDSDSELRQKSGITGPKRSVGRPKKNIDSRGNSDSKGRQARSKRSIGLPIKYHEDSEDETGSEEDQKGGSPRPKRSVGRPRKYHVDYEDDTGSEEEQNGGSARPKRSVGRPRKYHVDSEDDTGSEEEQEGGSPRPKRSVGRPRKSHVDIEDDTGSEEEQKGGSARPKRSVGRPRKSHVDSEDDTGSEEEQKCGSAHPKRSVGRPRKSHVDIEDDTGSEEEQEGGSPRPKRSVGRPRKSCVDNQNETGSEEEQKGGSARPKRSVGRPRKSNVDHEDDTGSEEEQKDGSAHPKRSVGRPRKSCVANQNETGSEEERKGGSPRPKQGRGRPRKLHVDRENETDSEGKRNVSDQKDLKTPVARRGPGRRKKSDVTPGDDEETPKRRGRQRKKGQKTPGGAEAKKTVKNGDVAEREKEEEANQSTEEQRWRPPNCENVDLEEIPDKALNEWRKNKQSLKKYKCPKCSILRKTFESIVSHYKQCSPVTDFQCTRCSRNFTTFPGLRYHCMSDHSVMIMQKDLHGRDDVEALEGILSRVQRLRCDMCTSVFRRVKRYVFHREWCGKESEKGTCERCNKQVRLMYMKAHMKAHDRMEKKRLEGGATSEISEEMEVLFTSDEDVESNPPVEEVGDGKTPKRRAAKVAQNNFKCLGLEDKDEHQIKAINWADYYTSPDLPDVPEEELEKLRLAVLANRKYVCSNKGCTRELTTKNGLKYHYPRCLSLENPPHIVYRCKKCDHSLTVETNMRIHVKACYPIIEEFKVCEKKVRIPPPDKDDGDIVINLSSASDDDDDDVSSGVPESESSDESTLSLPASGQRTARVSGNRMHSNPALAKMMRHYEKVHYQDVVFEDWMPREEYWKEIPLEEVPKLSDGPQFKILGRNSKKEIRRLGTLPLYGCDTSGPNLTMNVGTPAWAVEWCPIPPSRTRLDQYLAVAPSEEFMPMKKTIVKRGSVQLWNCRKIGCVSHEISGVHLSYVMVHEFGHVFEMRWCPGGAMSPWDSEKTNNKHCLGLLALACSEGSVKIISVRFPKSLMKQRTDKPCAFHVKASVSLERFNQGITKHVPVCMDWAKTDAQRVIAAGFSDGVVALWDLSTTSPLLKEVNPDTGQVTLRPYNVFYAHICPVRCMGFNPHSANILFTSSMDHQMCFWNLAEKTGPYEVNRRGYQLGVAWSTHLNAVYFIQDDAYTVINNNGTLLFYLGNYDNYTHTSRLLQSKDTVLTVDMSPWLDILVHGDHSGLVMAIAGISHARDTKRWKKLRFWMAKFETELRQDVKDEAEDRDEEEELTIETQENESEHVSGGTTSEKTSVSSDNQLQGISGLNRTSVRENSMLRQASKADECLIPETGCNGSDVHVVKMEQCVPEVIMEQNVPVVQMVQNLPVVQIVQVQMEQNVPVVQKQESVPMVETEPNVAVVQMEQNVPVVQMVQNLPVAQMEQNVPEVQKQESVPMVETEPNVAVVQMEQNIPVVHKQESVPVVQIVQNVPVVQMEQLQAVQTVPVVQNVPVVQIQENIPVVHSEENVPVGQMEQTVPVAKVEHVPVVHVQTEHNVQNNLWETAEISEIFLREKEYTVTFTEECCNIVPMDVVTDSGNISLVESLEKSNNGYNTKTCVNHTNDHGFVISECENSCGERGNTPTAGSSEQVSVISRTGHAVGIPGGPLQTSGVNLNSGIYSSEMGVPEGDNLKSSSMQLKESNRTSIETDRNHFDSRRPCVSSSSGHKSGSKVTFVTEGESKRSAINGKLSSQNIKNCADREKKEEGLDGISDSVETLDEAHKKYNLVVRDFDLSNRVQSDQNIRGMDHITLVPQHEMFMGAVTKVKWNNNSSAYTWLAVATQSGLVRLINVRGIVDNFETN